MYHRWYDDEAPINPPTRSRQRGKRPSGAEVKRRRLAREAAAQAENNSFLENYFSKPSMDRNSSPNSNSQSRPDYTNLLSCTTQLKTTYDYLSPPKPVHFVAHTFYKSPKAPMQNLGALFRENQEGYNNKESRFSPEPEHYEMQNGNRNSKEPRFEYQSFAGMAPRPVNFRARPSEMLKSPTAMNYENNSRGQKRKCDSSRSIDSIDYRNHHDRLSPVATRVRSGSRNYGNISRGQSVSPDRSRPKDRSSHWSERSHVSPIRKQTFSSSRYRIEPVSTKTKGREQRTQLNKNNSGKKMLLPRYRTGPVNNKSKQQEQRLPKTNQRQGAIGRPEPPKGIPDSKLVGRKRLPPVKQSRPQVSTKVFLNAGPPLAGKARKRYLKVAILDHSKVGKLNQEQADLLMKNLWQQLEQTLVTTPQNPPRFNAMTFSGGFLRVTCANDDSLAWLRKTVKELKPWPQAKLYLVQSNSLEQLTKVSFWIPSVKERGDKDKDASIKLLNCQNPELHVTAWCLFEYEKKVNPPGELFVFGINARDMGRLKLLNFKISYGFQFLIGKVVKDNMQKFEKVQSEVKQIRVGDDDVALAVEKEVVAVVAATVSKMNTPTAKYVLAGVGPVVAEKVVAVMAEKAAPVMAEDIATVFEATVVPVVAEKAVPVMAEDIPTVVEATVVPAVAEKAIPVMEEDIATVVAEAIVPVVTEAVVPVLTEVVASVVAEAVVPVMTEAVVPVVTAAVVPVAAKDDTSVLVEKVVSVVPENVVRNLMEEVVMVVTEDAASVGTERVTPVVAKEVAPTVTMEMVGNEVTLTATQEVNGSKVALAVTQEITKEVTPAAIQDELVKEVTLAGKQEVDSWSERDKRENEVVLAELVKAIETP